MTFSMPNYLSVSQFLPQYLSRGLSDIVMVSHVLEEENRGWGDEDVHETIVARKGAQFVRLRAFAHHPVGFGKGRVEVGSEEVISESEYAGLTHGKSIIDTPEIRNEIEQESLRAVRKIEVQSQLTQMAPSCPKCGGQTEQRNGPYGPFWGCLQYPNCNGTTKMSPEAKHLYDELS